MKRTRVLVTLGDLEKARERLAAIPEKDKNQRLLSKQAAIAHMAKEIKGLRDRGYSWNEVAEFISAQGVAVTAATVKTALARAGLMPRKKGGAKGPASPGKPRAGTAPPPIGRGRPLLPGSPPEESSGTFRPREDSEL